MWVVPLPPPRLFQPRENFHHPRTPMPPRRFHACAILRRKAVAVGGSWLLAICFVSAGQAVEPPARLPGKVILVRGFLTVFSLGLDDLAIALERERLDVQVVPACLAHATITNVCHEYATGRARGPIVLIGHSLGGDLLASLARQCGQQRLPVDLLVMLDSTNPVSPPPNVRRCVNLYQSNLSPTWFRVFRGAPITAESRNTQLVNIDIRELPERYEAEQLDHFNFESSVWIHRMVMREVLPVFGSRAPSTTVAEPGWGTPIRSGMNWPVPGTMPLPPPAVPAVGRAAR